MNITIYCLYDSERDHYESWSKGWRRDVYVKIESMYYNLTLYDIARLSQDFEHEMEEQSYFDMKSNLILVKEVKPEYIIHTVRKLHENGFFEDLKPVAQEMLKTILSELKMLV